MTEEKLENNNWSPQLPDIYKVLLTEEGMLHGCKHGPVQSFLRLVPAMKLKISQHFY